MKQTLLLLTLITIIAFPGLSRGQVVLSFTPVGNTSIIPGGQLTFNVNLTVSGGESVAAVDYYIMAPGSNQFTLLTFDNSASTFNIFGPTNPNNTALNPASPDLGASPSSPVGNGSYFLSQITLQASPTLSEGSYNLTAFQADWIDGTSGTSFNVVNFSLPTASLQVDVVPEPTTWMLLLLGSLFVATLTCRTKNKAS